MRRRGIVIPFRKAPEPPRGFGWVVPMVLAGAVVLGIAALLGGCGHSQIGKCPPACTPDPSINGTQRICMDSDDGRLCGYETEDDPCVDFMLRRERSGKWEPMGSRCVYGHGT